MQTPQEHARRRATTRLGVALQVVLAAVLLLTINYASYHYYWRGDWSPTQKYRLSEQTRQLLGNLPAPVTFYVFFSPTTAAPGYEVYGDVLNLLKEYQFAARDKITVEYIDPMRNLARARELQSRFQFGPEENLVIAEMDDRSKQIAAVDLAEYDYLPQLTGDPPRVIAFRGEQFFTSALLELSEPEQRAIYFLQGHGEPPVDENSNLSLLYDYISRQGVRVAPLNLSLAGTVPDDAGAVVLAGPRYDLTPGSLAALDDYWNNNGRLMVLLDPETEAPLLHEFLASVGVNPRDDRVLRTVALGFATGIMRDVSGNFSPDNRVTRRLHGAEAMFPGGTCSLELDQPDPSTVLSAMITAEEPFWGETDYVTDETRGVVFNEETDTGAPLVMAAMAERGGVADEKVGLSSSRLVVTGNSQFVADGFITEPNLDFVLGSLNWMLDRGHLTGITPKPVRAFSLNLTDLETGRIAFSAMVVIPGIAALAALVVWWRRRR
jgi:ABC-type uncharacterized transport system involved in gliding motility auxiliary subunit